jgi:hypothetical protein
VDDSNGQLHMYAQPGLEYGKAKCDAKKEQAPLRK